MKRKNRTLTELLNCDSMHNNYIIMLYTALNDYNSSVEVTGLIPYCNLCTLLCKLSLDYVLVQNNRTFNLMMLHTVV